MKEVVMKRTRWFGVLLASMLLLSLLPVSVHGADAFAFGEDLSMMCVIDGSTLTISPRTEDSKGVIPVFARISYGSSYYVTSPWFSYSDQIETVVLEEGVANIPTNAFTGMTKLKSIHIPLSVKEIAADGFLSCSGLTDVYYAGLPGNWGDITISAMPRQYNPANNSFYTPTDWLSRAKRHYADGSESGSSAISYDEARGSGTVDPGSGTEDGIAYSFDPEEGTLTISPGENGIMREYNFDGRPAWDKGRNLIKTIVIEDGVKNVGSGAFKECMNLTEVRLGNTVETLGTYAFRQCTSLTGIHIPAGVTRIEDDAFNGCVGMETITVDEGNQSYTAPANVLYTKDMQTLVYYPAQRSGSSYEVPEGVTAIAGVSFCDAAGLEEISLPSTLKSIGHYAFEGCGFYEIELPEGLETTREFIFNRCIHLEKVHLPASLKKLGMSPFNRCTALKTITVDADSETYADRDGILFSKDGKTLWCYPAGKGAPAYAVPEGVEAIGIMAFKQASMLTALGLPSSLKDVGVGEIYDEVVHWNAFSECEALKNVYYNGTREQWDTWAKDGAIDDSLIRGVNNGGGSVIMHWNSPMPDLPRAVICDKKTVRGEDGNMVYSFTVTCGSEKARAWFGLYSASGRFLGIESRPLTEGKNELSFVPMEDEAVSYRLFLFTDGESIPMCTAWIGDLYGGYIVE